MDDCLSADVCRIGLVDWMGGLFTIDKNSVARRFVKLFWSWIAFMYLVLCVSMFFQTNEYRILDRLNISVFWLPIWIWFQFRK